MTHNNRLKTLSALIMASTLFACGGGSGGSDNGGNGGGTTPEGTASKYTGKASFATLNESNAVQFISDILIESESFVNDDTFKYGVIDVEDVLKLPGISSISINSLEQTPSTTENCDSGSISLTNSLKNGLGSLSLSFNQCYFDTNYQNLNLSGGVSLQFNNKDSYNTPTAYSVNFNNLKFDIKSSDGNTSESFLSHGTSKVEQDGEDRKYTSNVVVNMTSSDSGSSSEMTKNFTITESKNTNDIKEYDITGDYYDGTQGKVAVTTLTPLTFNDYSYRPISGSIELTGNNNSKVKLVAENYAHTIYIDADADGIYESKIYY